MSDELVTLATEVSPYVMAAVSAYGAKVLDAVAADSADATVSVGRRILRTVFGRRTEVPEALVDLVEDPEDADFQAALRLAIRKELARHPELVEEVRALVPDQPGTGNVTNSIVNSTISGNALQLGNVTGDIRIGRD